MAVTIPPTYGKTDEGRIVVRHIPRADGVRCGGQVVLR